MPQPIKPVPPPPNPGRFATLIEGDADAALQGPTTASPPVRAATLLEPDSETQKALASSPRGPVPVHTSQTTAPSSASNGPVATPFRPTNRPPLATLVVCDDGKPDGELIRIRDPRFVIGRTEGDLRIAIDGRISARHVEISLQAARERPRWVVTDLQSTHGMFVRVSRAALADRSEFLVGGGRYRFDSSQGSLGETIETFPEAGGRGETVGWDSSANSLRPPALVELIGNEVGNRILLVKPEYWIGTDPSCPISRTDDPFCEPRHARLSRGPGGHWHVEHDRTLNGLWLRMTQVAVDSIVYFQIGEQRFRLRVQTS